jgi:tRNA nucleotidyltransferase/poly(A) polymerase
MTVGEINPYPYPMDPSALTTAQLLREVGILKELMLTMFAAMEQKNTALEQQRIEQKNDTKINLDAALSAAKEAVKEQTIASDKAIQKSEQGTKDQLAQMNTTFQAAIVSLTKSLDELKDRVTSIEQFKKGGQEKMTGIYAMVGFFGTILLLVNGIIAFGTFK